MLYIDEENKDVTTPVETTVENTSNDAPATTETKEVVKAEATKTVVADKKPSNDKPGQRKTFGNRPGGGNKFGNNKRRKGGFKRRGRDSEFEEKVIDIARVTKVVKGGRRFSFSAFVVIGNRKGKVAYGHGKANEVPDAIKKAIKDAKTRITTVPIIEKRTVPHELQAKFLASTVLLKPAPKGKGIIASGAIRAVVELAGYKDIYTKSLGRSRSKQNSVKAVMAALGKMRTAKEVAEIRGLTVAEILGK